jgi:hypothetical protein
MAGCAGGGCRSSPRVRRICHNHADSGDWAGGLVGGQPPGSRFVAVAAWSGGPPPGGGFVAVGACSGAARIAPLFPRRWVS